MKSLPNKILALILSMIFCCDVSLFTNDWYRIKWVEIIKTVKEFKTIATMSRLLNNFFKLDY